MIQNADLVTADYGVDDVLTRHFLLDHPRDAARSIEALPVNTVAEVLRGQPIYILVPVFQHLASGIAADIIAQMPQEQRAELLSKLSPLFATSVIGQWDSAQRETELNLLPKSVHHELKTLMDYPPNSAGRLMDTRIPFFRPSMSVNQALDILRKGKLKTARAVFLVDDDGHLTSKVHIQQLATAELDVLLSELAKPVTASVQSLADQEEVSALFDHYQLLDLPVVDIDQRLLGIIYHASLVKLTKEDLASDVLTMVGASREERALSKPMFAVKKRLPWLQINLITAFLAASVVGVFENIIAQFTALAVLLPVVAGQSGNAGAQALAVTMRGLALREITTRQWSRVMFKEVRTGFVNGVCCTHMRHWCIYLEPVYWLGGGDKLIDGAGNDCCRIRWSTGANCVGTLWSGSRSGLIYYFDYRHRYHRFFCLPWNRNAVVWNVVRHNLRHNNF